LEVWYFNFSINI